MPVNRSRRENISLRNGCFFGAVGKCLLWVGSRGSLAGPMNGRLQRKGDDEWLKPGTGEGPVLTDTGRAAFIGPFALGK